MKYKLYQRGFVFDFETQSLRNYKSGEFANVAVGHYLYGEDGSCFSYERDVDPFLRRCISYVRYGWFGRREVKDIPPTSIIHHDPVDYVYYVNARRGFCRSTDKYRFDADTKWCYLYEYYKLSERWYDVYEIYDEELRREISRECLIRKLRNIGWMNK